MGEPRLQYKKCGCVLDQHLQQYVRYCDQHKVKRSSHGNPVGERNR